ncbi:MAG: DUF192 domain-containing protein [Bryobacteraceae bacterium]|nr:DUF192 domain-containing protein [Bryobacteraceae bacterium]
MPQRIPRVLALFVFALAWSCGERPATLDTFNTRLIALPNGSRVRAEVAVRPEDVMRGMMFRDSLAEDRGMLFIHGEPGKYTYYMYQVRIPLDILWLDANRRIVEISANTPPCTTRASECPLYGGNEPALYVLELAAGSVERHGLRVGQQLSF